MKKSKKQLFSAMLEPKYTQMFERSAKRRVKTKSALLREWLERDNKELDELDELDEEEESRG